MRTAQIKAMKAAGHSNDSIYQHAAGLVGMFGIAFFGHKATHQQRRTLNNLWKRILNA